MGQQITAKSATIAKIVELWCEQLKHPKYDNGQSDFKAAMIGRQEQDRLVAAAENSAEKVKVFSEYLTKNLSRAFSSGGSPVVLSIDYAPGPRLQAAINAACIPYRLFPCMSAMRAIPGRLTYRFGATGRVVHLELNDEMGWTEVTNPLKLTLPLGDKK